MLPDIAVATEHLHSEIRHFPAFVEALAIGVSKPGNCVALAAFTAVASQVHLLRQPVNKRLAFNKGFLSAAYGIRMHQNRIGGAIRVSGR